MLTNMNVETGIRYGVTHDQVVGTSWYDRTEPDYGPATCPKCGGECVIPDYDKHSDYDNSEGGDYACESCQKMFDGQDVFPAEPLCHVFEDIDLTATQRGGDWDIFVTKSPYYAKVRLCSPCAPNAGDLSTPDEAYGYKAYCFGHDWYDNDTAPYPVWRVADDSECFTASQAVERGAAMLDEVIPDWESKMTGGFDMHSLKNDILGKVSGTTMWAGAEMLFPGIMTKNPKVANDLLAPLGFVVQLDFNNAANYGRSRRDTPDYTDLDKAWLELIDKRVAARGTIAATQDYVKGLA